MALQWSELSRRRSRKKVPGQRAHIPESPPSELSAEAKRLISCVGVVVGLGERRYALGISGLGVSADARWRGARLAVWIVLHVFCRSSAAPDGIRLVVLVARGAVVPRGRMKLREIRSSRGILRERERERDAPSPSTTRHPALTTAQQRPGPRTDFW
ncbi:hypothetical protein LZ30DRAFT_36601 [Colletotrichum cereale]|nr:hypothetical protein LZ30DRAFT_36601 [Colletotrichum cereale]